MAALVLGAEGFLLVVFSLLHHQLTAENLHLNLPGNLPTSIPGEGQKEVPNLISVFHRSEH